MAVTASELKAVLTLQSDMAAKLAKDEGALRSMAASLAQVQTPAKSMGTALAGAGSAADAASRQFQALGKQSTTMGDSLKQGLAVGAGFGLVSAGIGFIGKAFQATKGSVIDFNSQMQSAEAAFTGLLGSGTKARSFLGELQQFAATTPFEFPDVVKASQRFLGMGVAANKVIPLMRDIGTAVSAVGGNSESINRVTVALSQMMARGRVSAQDMNQLTEAQIPAWTMLAKALDLPISKIRELSETGAISSEVMVDALHKAANTPEMLAVAENMSKSWNAVTSNMADGVRMFIGGAARPLFDELTKVVGGVGNWLVKSEEAKTVQAALTASVRALMEVFGPMAAGALRAGQALLQIGAALPIFERLRAIFASMGGGGKTPIDELVAGIDTATTSGAQLEAEAKAVNDELAAMPKAAAQVSDQLAANERAMKNNAIAAKAVAAGLREVQAEAEAVKAIYDAQAAAVRKEIDAVDAAQIANKQLIDEKKAGYEAETNALKAQQSAVEAQQQAVKQQAEDIKAAYEDLAAPIEAALAATEGQLRDNATAADDVRQAYADQIDPLERALGTLKSQMDVQRQQEDLVNRIKSAELARAKVAAIGDPIERAKVAAALDMLDAKKDGLELEKRAADIRARLKDDKAVSPQEREILKIDLARLDLQKRLAGMTDQQALAEIKVAEAALAGAKDQQDIQRATEDMALSAQQQVINGLKAEEKARLDVLGKQRAELERQAADQKAMLEGLKTSLEAALAPLEARAKALARQHDDIATAIKAVEVAEQKALAPLIARGKELDRQKAEMEQRIKAIKAAEEAALEPIKARQKELEKVQARLQDERDTLAGIKNDLDLATEAATKHAAVLQGIAKELATPPVVPDVPAQEGADPLAASVAKLREELEKIGSILTPVVVGIAAYGVAAGIAAVATGALALSLAPVSIAMIAIGVGVGLLATIWSQNWGDIQGKSKVVIDWLVGSSGFAAITAAGELVWKMIQTSLGFWRDLYVEIDKRGLFADLKKIWDDLYAAGELLGGSLQKLLNPQVTLLTKSAGEAHEPLITLGDVVQKVADIISTQMKIYQFLVDRLTDMAKLTAASWSGIAELRDMVAGFVVPPLWQAFADLLDRISKFKMPEWPGGGRAPASPGNADLQLTSYRGGGGAVPTVSQFNTGLLSASEAKSACGPAAYVWFMNNYGRNPSIREATDLAKSFGWTEGGGMAGAGSFQRMLQSQGVRAEMIGTGDIDAALTAGRPVAVSTEGHYFQVAGGNARDGYNVGASGTAYAGGSATMTLAAMEKLTGAINGVIAGQARAPSAPASGNWAAVAFQAALQASLPDPEMFAAQMAHESAGFAPAVLSGAQRGAAGERGVGQFMPGTAEEAAGLINVSMADFWASTELQLRGAAALMAQYTQQFGSQTRAMSAYNAGPGGREQPGYVNLVEGRRESVRGASRDGMQSDLMLADLEKALAESFHIRPEIFAPMAAQVKAFTDLMSQDAPTGQVTDALARMQAAMAPVENAVANATMSLPELERTLVEMGARAGLSNEPLEEMQAGLIMSSTALQEMVASIASADPRFAALLTNLDKTGSSTASFALDVLALLNALNTPITPPATAAPAGAAPSAATAPPPAAVAATAALTDQLAAVQAVGAATAQQTALMTEGWRVVTEATALAVAQIGSYTSSVAGLPLEPVEAQRAAWRSVAKSITAATDNLAEYAEALATMPAGAVPTESLPEFHTGGLVERGGAAVLERGERVLTADQQRGGGDTYNVTINTNGTRAQARTAETDMLAALRRYRQGVP